MPAARFVGGPLPERFERRTVRLAPGDAVAFVPDEWLDTLVVVRAGELDARTRSGRRLRFLPGDSACLTGLDLRLLENRGAVPVLLDTVRRRRRDAAAVGAPVSRGRSPDRPHETDEFRPVGPSDVARKREER